MTMRLKLKENGFSLIEVIVSIAILAMVAIPVFGSLYSSLNADRTSAVLTEESTIAQNIAEGIKSGDITTKRIDGYSLNDRVYKIGIDEIPKDNGISLYNINVKLKDSDRDPYLLAFFYKSDALSDGGSMR